MYFLTFKSALGAAEAIRALGGVARVVQVRSGGFTVLVEREAS